jgi:hypothetical protein
MCNVYANATFSWTVERAEESTELACWILFEILQKVSKLLPVGAHWLSKTQPLFNPEVVLLISGPMMQLRVSRKMVRIAVNCAPPRRPAGIQADRAFGHDGVKLSSQLGKPTKVSYSPFDFSKEPSVLGVPACISKVKQSKAGKVRVLVSSK